MRTIALVLAVITSAPTFCLQLQQTRAASPDRRDPVTVDINDSEAFFQAATRGSKPSRDNTSRVEELLARMTLEEKVGQMTQLEIGMISSGKDQDIQIDPAKLEQAVMKYGVGSIL